MSFKDHFSGHADSYARFRPGYPEPLYEWIATQAPGRQLAWDCATGSGQAARGLSRHFRRVCASDASAAQIASAAAADGVEFRVAPADASGLEAASVDAVTVAQALHWFDLPAFYAEARRVARAGAPLVAWSYGPAVLDGDAGEVLGHFYREVVGRFWPPERELVEQGYRTLPFPSPELTPPAFSMSAAWPLDALLGYVSTWSATRRCAAAKGRDPMADLARELAPCWGPDGAIREVRWRLAVRAAHLR